MGGGVGNSVFFQGWGALVEEVGAFKPWFQPGPRPDPFNRGGSLIKS